MTALSIAILGTATSGFAGTANADAFPFGFYKTVYAPDIYEYGMRPDQSDSSGGSTVSLHRITYEYWQAAGFPAPRLFATTFQKYTFRPEIYAVTVFPSSTWPVILDWEQWRYAGFPVPRVTRTLLPNSVVTKYASSDELFLWMDTQPVTQVRLTFENWQDLGFPTPRPSDTGYYRLSWTDSPGIARVYPYPFPTLRLLTGVDLADVGVIGVADDPDMNRPRPGLPGGAVVGSVMVSSAG